MHFLIIRITAFQPAGDLFRRLVLMHLLCNDFTQCGLSISLQGFGLRAFSHAAVSAFAARYCLAPPCLLTSRLIVEGAFDNLAAMSLILSFVTTPLDISSLLSSESANRYRFRTGGR
jgi:hypothetical protein